VNVISLRTLFPAGDTHRIPALFLILCCCMLFFAPLTGQAAPKKSPEQAPAPKTSVPTKAQAIILPFDVEIPGSYAYLKSGLASTLASRLATRANIAAVAQGAASEQMASALKSGDHSAFGQLLRQSGADYLIMGSLASRSGQFELTSYVFSQASGKGPKKFLQHFNTVDEAMTAIDELAWDISSSMFGKERPEAAQTSTKQTGGVAGFQTAHPARAYLDGQYAGMSSGLEAGGAIELANSFRSKNIPVEAMDINAGDLDGDGKEEIVLLTKSSLMIYRYDDSQFRMLATVDLPNHLRYHSVTLGDLNKNGLQEIYISGSNQDIPDSSALEWNGKKVTFLFEHVGWYLRTMTSPGEMPILLGQRSLAGTRESAEVHQMTLDARNTVTEGQRLNLPKGINIFDFVLADLDGSGNKLVVAISNDNRLQLYDSAGSVRWTSPEIFGASNNFFGTLTSTNNAAFSDKETSWVRTRIVVADLDADGINDILVGRNRLETVNFMPNLRYFDGSSLTAFKWDRFSLVRLWETKKIPGYITNYQVVNGDKGSAEFRLVFAEAETSYPFVFWQSASTFLNSYTLRVKAVGQ
jgi:hypothetical protein